MLESSVKTVLALDIDQTLAGGVVPAHMGLYDRELGLGMSPEQIAASEQFPNTFSVPQILEYRAPGGEAEQRFQAVRAAIRTSSEVHLNLQPMPSSVQRVHEILNGDGGINFGGYYTVRPTELTDCTPQWLAQEGFPEPEKTTICLDPEDKIRKVAKDHLQSQAGTVAVLVDDGVAKLVEAACKIVAAEPEMTEAMKRLVIVGFGPGASEVEKYQGQLSGMTGAKLLPLESWEEEHVTRLRQALTR